MAKQIDPDLVPQKRTGSTRQTGEPRTTTANPKPTPARMRAGKGISNGVKPGKQRAC